MLVLDSNHLRELAYRTPLGHRLQARLLGTEAGAVTTVVCAEELMRGRMARIAAARTASEQMVSYACFTRQIEFLADYTLLPWDEEAAERFKSLRAQGVRIGTMDLRIACITLEHDSLLLTRNTVDFSKVPSLRFENWLD